MPNLAKIRTARRRQQLRAQADREVLQAAYANNLAVLELRFGNASGAFNAGDLSVSYDESLTDGTRLPITISMSGIWFKFEL